MRGCGGGAEVWWKDMAVWWNCLAATTGRRGNREKAWTCSQRRCALWTRFEGPMFAVTSVLNIAVGGSEFLGICSHYKLFWSRSIFQMDSVRIFTSGLVRKKPRRNQLELLRVSSWSNKNFSVRQSSSLKFFEMQTVNVVPSSLRMWSLRRKNESLYNHPSTFQQQLVF